MASLEEKLAAELECPVCAERMTPPITMCVNGHNTCRKCKPQMKACPICKGKFTEIRCYAMENLVANMKRSCAYADAGCKQVLTMGELAQHEDDCGYQPFKCPFGVHPLRKCSWVGEYHLLYDHVVNEHRYQYSKQEIGEVRRHCFMNYAVGRDTASVRMVGRDIFVMFLVPEEDNLYVCMLYLGPKCRSRKFSYAIHIEGRNRRRSETSYNLVLEFGCDMNSVFDKKDCAVIEQKVIRDYLDNAHNLIISITMFYSN